MSDERSNGGERDEQQDPALQQEGLPTEFVMPDDDGGAASDEPIDKEALRPPESRSKLGLTLIVVCLAILGLAGIMVVGNAKLRDQVDAFLGGEIAKYKVAEKKVWEDRFRELETKTKPFYGEVVLTYYPQDSKVTITDSVKTYATFKDFQEGKVTSTTETVIPNQTDKLKPGEIVKQLPLRDLPIRGREFTGPALDNPDGITTAELAKVDVKVVEHEYKVTIEKEGYKKRDFVFAVNAWERPSPVVNAMFNFPGCDLEPEPETMKANFVGAHKEMFCLEKFEKDRQKLLDYKKQIQIRHHFKTTEEFERISDALTGDVEWWARVWKDEVEKQKCEKPDYVTP